MTDRIEFYEVRQGTFDDWKHVCLCKDKSVAEKIAAVWCSTGYDASCFIECVEIVANVLVDIDIEDY